MHAMESLLSPSPSIFTTIFYKPVWLVKVIFAAIPFLVSNKNSIIEPKVNKFFEAIHADPTTSSLKVGVAGYCWGGRYTILLAQKENLVDAAFTAHPSKMEFPTEWDKIQKPISVAIGDVDMGIKIDMVRDIKKLLEEMKDGKRNEVVIYEGAKHGFAVRANPEDERQTKSQGEAKDQAIRWFTRWFVEGV
jgi:dienelactone hydrolase